MVKEVNTKNSRNRKWPAVLAILLVLYGISLFVPLISPFSRYPLFVVYCRRLPIVANNFAGGRTYTLPSDSRFYKVDPFTDYYFCTEKDAQVAGFSRYP
jgi:hypothetical protein